MTYRSLLPLVIAYLSACQELPFLSRSSGPADAGAEAASASGAAAAPGGLSDLGFGGPADGVGAPGAGGSFGADNTSDGVAVNGGADSLFVPPPWDVDGSSGLPFAIPDPSTLPSASLSSDQLALTAAEADGGVRPAGCGEPRSCYLRTIIATARGKLYSASLSNSYPKDTCVTKTIDCDHAILVGDSNPRYADSSCSQNGTNITLGLLLPQYLAFGWRAGQVWESSNGFRSEWTLSNAGDDSGSYEPVPGLKSKLLPLWSRYFYGGEVYGELLVPLRHRDTHRFALGFALFDIRVRR
jgi:hypothetical protein